MGGEPDLAAVDDQPVAVVLLDARLPERLGQLDADAPVLPGRVRHVDARRGAPVGPYALPDETAARIRLVPARVAKAEVRERRVLAVQALEQRDDALLADQQVVVL